MFQYHTTPHSPKWWVLRGQIILNLVAPHCWKKHLRHFPVILSSISLLFPFLFLIFGGRLILVTKIFIQQILKYVSVYLNTYLTCNTNVTVLLPKLSREAGLLAKIWHYTIKFLLKTIYYSLFDSHLIYTWQIWGEIKNDLFTMLPPTWKM